MTSTDSSSRSLRSLLDLIQEHALFGLEPGILVLKQPGPLPDVPPVGVAQTHDMEFFLRYFVEVELPTTAVEAALDEWPADWLVAVANKAHDRAIGFMLEADPHAADDLAGAVVVLGMEPATRRGSTTIRTMAWGLIGPKTARPLLEADLEVGSLGDRRNQPPVAGPSHCPGAVR